MHLALTMPLCVYSCKANLLINTYMKMGRHEGALCAINVAAMVLNGTLTCAITMGFTSVKPATCAIVLTVALRDLAFNLFMAKKFITASLPSALPRPQFRLDSWPSPGFLGLGAGLWFRLYLLCIFASIGRECGLSFLRSRRSFRVCSVATPCSVWAERISILG